jgi:hypothetical protein
MPAVVREAQRWAIPDAVTRPVRPAAAELAPGAFALDAAAARFRTAAVPAADAPVVPLPEVVVAWEALDATAVPRRAAVAVGAVSDVAAVLPRVAAVRHAGAAAVEAAPHAAAGAAGRPAARAEALLAAAAVPAVALPSAVAWVFRQDRLRPAAPSSKVRLAAARPVSETRPAHAMRCLPIASRSTRLSQAAQDGIWSWRSLFLESLL